MSWKKLPGGAGARRAGDSERLGETPEGRKKTLGEGGERGPGGKGGLLGGARNEVNSSQCQVKNSRDPRLKFKRSW